MKTFNLLLFVFILTACSSSDDNSNNTNQFFNPPSWIQGTWGQIVQDPYIETPYFRFKSDDFCTLASILETCFKDYLIATSNSGIAVNVSENTTNDSYQFSYNISGQTTHFKFVKISENHIELINPNQGLPNTPLYKL